MANEENLEEEVKNQETEAQENTEEQEELNQEQPVEEVEEIELSAEEKLQAEVAEQKDKFLRLYSEFENFRKRTAKEKLDLIATGNENLILSILPVVDDFDRALKANEDVDDAQAIKDGVILIKDKFVKALEAKGLTEITIEENGEFGDANTIENKTKLKFNDENYLTFNSRRNRKISLTEYYDLIYEYKNDCLVAGIKYNKTYYEDRDLKPSENLLFTITLSPLTSFEQKVDK